MKATTPRPEDRPYFFDGGLRFECTACGKCCAGAPGTVFMNRAEADRIARHLQLETDDFLRQYAYPYKHGHSLREVGENYACIFFKDNRCTVYEVRPTQCRTYPFWSENVRSEMAWRKTGKACPGTGQGRLFTREEILARLAEATDELSRKHELATADGRR